MLLSTVRRKGDGEAALEKEKVKSNVREVEEVKDKRDRGLKGEENPAKVGVKG